MTEKEIFQMAHSWATHLWYQADSEIRKKPYNKIYQLREIKAWRNIMEIERIAEEKGYDL